MLWNLASTQDLDRTQKDNLRVELEERSLRHSPQHLEHFPVGTVDCMHPGVILFPLEFR